MFMLAIGLYALTSCIILFRDFRTMGWISRVTLLVQFVALIMMVVAWLGISF